MNPYAAAFEGPVPTAATTATTVATAASAKTNDPALGLTIDGERDAPSWDGSDATHGGDGGSAGDGSYWDAHGHHHAGFVAGGYGEYDGSAAYHHHHPGGYSPAYQHEVRIS